MMSSSEIDKRLRVINLTVRAAKRSVGRAANHAKVACGDRDELIEATWMDENTEVELRNTLELPPIGAK